MSDIQDIQSESDRLLYADLSAEINPTFTDRRGGVDLEYHTGEQVVSKLNETLGFLNWSFVVVEHGIHAEADECWALGELTVVVGERIVKRQQFGSQKIKRSRSSGTPLDIGFDLKGAATDALKKCASLIGVGLYLWAKTPPQEGPAPSGPRSTVASNGDGPVCLQTQSDGSMCGRAVTGWEARGEYPARTPAQVAEWQIKRPEFGMPLCIGHQKAIKEGKAKPVRWQGSKPSLAVVGNDGPPVRPDDDDVPF